MVLETLLADARRVERHPQARRDARIPRVRNPDGANQGGACEGCGKQLEFWFIYQVCNQCLVRVVVRYDSA